MPPLHHHKEKHYSNRIGWLRAAVLGANDGIISTSALVMGVAAAGASSSTVLLAGVAGLVAGAMSMAAGEYVSVSSQADSERADLEREQRELEDNPEFERRELAGIYEDRGLDPELAAQVSRQLMEHDPLGAHARDELGLTKVHTARPIQAALASATTFSVGAALPLLAVLLMPAGTILVSVAAGSLACLALLGWLAAYAGGAGVLTSVGRVLFWGVAAMTLTVLVGRLIGPVV